MPVITIADNLQISGFTQAPQLAVVDLAGEYDLPVPNQVVYLVGFYGEGKLFANDDLTGHSIELLDVEGLTDNSKYKVVAAIEYIEPDATAATRRLRDDFDNAQARVLADPEEITDTVTAVNAIGVDTDVIGVSYVNVTGKTSDEPFTGVNIVVTSYRDGTTKVEKIIR